MLKIEAHKIGNFIANAATCSLSDREVKFTTGGERIAGRPTIVTCPRCKRRGVAVR